MKTFLLYPHGWVIFNNPPLGIAYLAAYMRQKGLDVDILTLLSPNQLMKLWTE